eukprot:CAMPEP_0171761454 /NCGR_PEP_ID=MMETSP0991-20121206/48068_1 /TAXON_ID=483369 /ORGANISM="non described non described, Strain CCMP2098" /LENGTH=155 /DNA_ID=CAMNT_0012364725 /DNA_START=14 /DNA_END=478 /DNA_ORIENTATION=-
MAHSSGDLLDDDEEDFCFTGDCGSAEDNAFDEAVGALENVLMDPGFVELQKSFHEKHCDEFEDSEENKLSYTQIFQSYCSCIESYLEKRVGEDIENFSLDSFGKMMATRKDEVCGDVFDLLMTLGDFNEFKEVMVEAKRSKARKTKKQQQRSGGQ